jgi:hypothetical protein
LYITPEGANEIDQDRGLLWLLVEVVIDGAWVQTCISQKELEQLLTDWNQEPEKALRDWFQVEPPTGAKAQNFASKAEATAEELGL